LNASHTTALAQQISRRLAAYLHLLHPELMEAQHLALLTHCSSNG
jgi:hypothetical protein